MTSLRPQTEIIPKGSLKTHVKPRIPFFNSHLRIGMETRRLIMKNDDGRWVDEWI